MPPEFFGLKEHPQGIIPALSIRNYRTGREEEPQRHLNKRQPEYPSPVSN